MLIDELMPLLQYDVRLMVDNIEALFWKYSNIDDETLKQAVNLIKSKVQYDALCCWLNSPNRRGMIAIATGGGKSKIAVDAASLLISSHPKARISLVVPTTTLRDENWKAEFETWGKLNIFENNVSGYCYAAIGEIYGQNYDFSIFDEVHNITDSNSLFFSQNNAGAVLCLSATPPTDHHKARLLESLGIPVIYELPLDLAVRLKLVAPYKVIVVGIDLDNSVENIQGGTKKQPTFTTELGAYSGLTKKIEYLETKPNAAIPLKMARMKRMHLIYDLPSKTKAAQWLLENYIPKEDKTLIFCGSINQANIICERRHHSKMKKSSRDLEAFKLDEINQLSVVDAINEGENIGGMDNGLVLKINSNETNIIQQIGRLIRYRPGHLARVVIVVGKYTVEEQWLMKAIGKLQNIEWLNFTDLKIWTETYRMTTDLIQQS
jgi:superfamily II DNA or RNA helicase